jgi:hypothetical protein
VYEALCYECLRPQAKHASAATQLQQSCSSSVYIYYLARTSMSSHAGQILALQCGFGHTHTHTHTHTRSCFLLCARALSLLYTHTLSLPLLLCASALSLLSEYVSMQAQSQTVPRSPVSQAHTTQHSSPPPPRHPTCHTPATPLPPQ